MTDLELAQAGDKAAMSRVVEAYQHRVYRFAYSMCHDEERARDVTQETMLQLLRSAQDFRGESDFSTWLFQIARSFCIKAGRRRVGEPAQHDDVDGPVVQHLAGGELLDEALHQRDVGEVVQAALQSLAPQYREVIVLKDIEGLTGEHIAEILHLELGAVKSRLHRARMALRQLVAPVLAGSGLVQQGCPQLEEALALYAGQDIDQALCREMDAHLETCADCRAACDQLKDTVLLCKNAVGEVPAPVRAALRRVVDGVTQ